MLMFEHHAGDEMVAHSWPTEGIDLERVRGIISRSSEHFGFFVSQAERAMHGGDAHAVAAWAQLAAGFAWNSHPGAYCSPPLENMLLRIAGGLGAVALPPEYRLPDGGLSRRRVLHVLTTALPTGGHTRVVERWIRNTMHNETHSIIIDSSGSYIPQWLRDAVQSSGGRLIVLNSPFQSLLYRAMILRQLAHEWANLVVLHSHPYDPLPILAFGVDAGPPVVLFNHADHVFWLGASVADVVADFRPIGQALSRQRRGRRETALLPIPLVQPMLEIDKRVAREQLGIDEQTTVLLTIASGYKYSPLGGFDFLELHLKVLDRFPDVVLLAVGPEDSGQWAEAKVASGGRIRAFGVQHDLGVFHAAADIYLDSFPFASLTSMFEVGLLDKPLIGLSNPVSMIHSGDDISLNSSLTHFSTCEEYEDMLYRLITDAGLRSECGQKVGRAIRSDHISPNWNTYLDTLMARLPERHSAAKMADLHDKTDLNDVFLTCIQESGGAKNDVNYFLSKQIRYLPATARFSLAFKNVRREGVFAERKLRMKAFRGYRVPSTRQFIDLVKKWWQRSLVD